MNWFSEMSSYLSVVFLLIPWPRASASLDVSLQEAKESELSALVDQSRLKIF